MYESVDLEFQMIALKVLLASHILDFYEMEIFCRTSDALHTVSCMQYYARVGRSHSTFQVNGLLGLEYRRSFNPLPW